MFSWNKPKKVTKTEIVSDVICEIHMLNGLILTKTFKAYFYDCFAPKSGNFNDFNSEKQLFLADNGAFYPYAQIDHVEEKKESTKITYTVEEISQWSNLYILVSSEKVLDT